jgi:uncharacterized protein (DUF4213/DUF364 family)
LPSSANASVSGMTFDTWIDDTTGIAKINAVSTTFTMPAHIDTITATYKKTTGLINPDEIQGIKIFPNPVNDVLFINQVGIIYIYMT